VTAVAPMIEFAEARPFKPLGISPPRWPTDPQGYNMGSFGISIRARDLAKFSYLYLNNGALEGKQIAPADYVRESTRRQNEAASPKMRALPLGCE